MIYSVKYHKQVIKFLKKQDKKIALEIISFFDTIKQNGLNFTTYDVKELKGFKNKYRLRIGKYRVIFSIYKDEVLIEVIKAGSRGDIYK